MQKNTAKKILARFIKNTQYETQGTQSESMYEITYEYNK